MDTYLEAVLGELARHCTMVDHCLDLGVRTRKATFSKKHLPSKVKAMKAT
jgi:hypothetical protein